jgi:2-oxoglutarate ferredoxin oxidoreductase subunit beta
VDVISPCVTFNNNKGSTKSYEYIREYMQATGTVDFIPEQDEITVEYAEGESTSIQLHDGSTLQLSKLSPNWDPTNRLSAFQRIQEAKLKGRF